MAASPSRDAADELVSYKSRPRPESTISAPAATAAAAVAKAIESVVTTPVIKTFLPVRR